MYSNGGIYVPDRKPLMGAVLNPYLLINRGLVGYWPMWSGAGSKVYDLSGEGIEGSFVSTTHWESGKKGSVVDYDGNSDLINFGDCFTFGDGSSDKPFSIVSLIYPRDATNFGILTKAISLSAGDSEWYFEISDNDKLRVSMCDSRIDQRIGRVYNTALTSLENTWIHVGMSYDGSGSSVGLRIYKDGIRVDDINNIAGSYVAMENTTTPVLSGSFLRDYSGGRWANGLIDHIYVYNRVLSASEFALLYREPFCGFRSMSIELWASVEPEEEPPVVVKPWWLYEMQRKVG